MSQALAYVELDINVCSLVHNQPPCLAALAGEYLATSATSWVFLNSTHSFTNNDCTFVAGTDAAVLTQTGSDPFIRTPADLEIDGATDFVVRIDVERTVDRSSGSWNGRLFYDTDGGHSESASFYKGFDDLALGQRTLVELDMSALSAGGTDWITSTITRLRVDFDNAASGAFKVYSIQVGHYATSDDATGEQRCFNSVATCQDRANYAASTATLRFAIGTDYLPADIDAIPIVETIAFSPGMIALGRDLGQRASVNVTLKDISWSDTAPGFDPYYAERDYNPFTQGSFWGKFRARQPFLQGNALRLIRGRVGQAIGEMETRHYVVESFAGPGLDGRYTIVAKDVLKLLDGDRAQAPAISSGRVESGIDSDDTSVTLTPTDVGDEYPASDFYLNLGGKEIVHVASRSGDVLTIDERGALGTTAGDHASGDRAQLVSRYEGEDPADIIYDLMVTHGGIDASFIDLEAWQAETAAFNRRQYTGTIAEPTPVSKLVSELIQQAALAIWWDDAAQKIRLQVLRQISTDAEVFGDGVLSPGSYRSQEQPEKRLSQIWTFYAQANPLEGQEDPNNYRASAITIDLEAEADYGAPKIEKIFSRWIPDGGRDVALRLNDLLIARFRNAPRRFSFSTFRDSGASPALGEGCLIESWPLQDASGARVQVPIQITRVDPGETEYNVEAEEFSFEEDSPEDPNERTIILDSSFNNENLRERHDLFYPDPVGGETVTCIVDDGVIIGSASTSQPAFTVGDWPEVVRSGNRTASSPIITGLSDTSDLGEGIPVEGAGIPAGTKILTVDSGSQVTLTEDATSGSGTATSLTFHLVIISLIVRGRLQGAGGKGGRGKTYAPDGGTVNATNGLPGGTALYVRRPIDLTDEDGRIYGGGGGGGGAGVLNLNQHKGGGGGGGAGRVSGAGGASDFKAGNAGTLDSGSFAGPSYASDAWYQAPTERNPGSNGFGGSPGAAGTTGRFFGSNIVECAPGTGGAGGNAIDGISFVTTVGSPGDRLGGTIN